MTNQLAALAATWILTQVVAVVVESTESVEERSPRGERQTNALPRRRDADVHDCGMSYDLAVWVGPRPENAMAASAEYARRMDAMEELLAEDKARPPAAPEIVEFVDTALTRFPGLTQESGRECPWASSPLMSDVVGDLIYFPLTFSGAEYARDELAEIAVSLGLVCYDPQIEGLLPDEEATSAAEIGAKAAAALGVYLAQREARSKPSGWIRRLLGSRD